MGDKYTIKNYDTSGSWSMNSRVPKFGDKKPETKIINGITYEKQGDGKICLSEFKTALIDFYQDTYGAVGSTNKGASIIAILEFQNFQQIVDNFDFGGEISIDNDDDFVALLTEKAKELRKQMVPQQEKQGNDSSTNKNSFGY